ncbi:MAG: TolC family protein [Treponema sp.]|jgi:outer membrane protein TolC|nr:TolC family protein [Treponema sp.]
MTLLFFLISLVLNLVPASANDYRANNNQLYESLTFAEASDLAILNSTDLRHSRASLALLEESWRWGLRAYFPRLSIVASENDRLQQLGPDSFIKNYGINLDQLLFDGGRTRMSRNLEKMELNLSSSRLDRMASEIGETAISVYRNVLSSRSILEIRKAALVVLEEQRRILNEEVNLGLALGIDLASADINLADAKLGIYSLELDLIEMEKQFAEILGLEYLPALTEKVDITRFIVLPEVMLAAAYARENNPDLVEARYSITRRQTELKYVSNSWIPTMRLTGNFGVSGQHYPLTRYNWSVGINIEFTSPWIQNRIGFQAGWEPPYDKTAMLQNSLTPLPDPASSIGKNQAKLALELEQENYALVYERIGRIAANAIEKYTFADQRRGLALQAVELGAERCRVEEVRLNLGHITRIKLMETLIEQTQREITAIEAATALLEAERELERFLDLRPGKLETFVSETFVSKTFVSN